MLSECSSNTIAVKACVSSRQNLWIWGDKKNAGEEKSRFGIDEERCHMPRRSSHVGGAAFREAVGI